MKPMRKFPQFCVHGILIPFVLAAAFVGVAVAQERPKLIVAITKGTANTAAFHIAKARGYFDAEGLDVEFSMQENSLTLTTAVISRAADIGSVGMAAGFYNVAGNQDIKIIAANTSEKPGYKSFAFVASNAAYAAGLRKPSDFAGKRIAYSAPGSGYHYNLILLSQKYNFPLKDLVSLQTVGNIAAAIKGQTVEAALLSGLPAIALHEQGDGKIVGWAGDEVPHSGYFIFTRDEIIKNKRDVLVRFMRAFIRATREYSETFQSGGAFGQKAKEVLEIIAISTGQPVEIVKLALPYVEPIAALDVAEVAKQVANWQALNLVNKNVDPKKLVDLSALLEAQRGK